MKIWEMQIIRNSNVKELTICAFKHLCNWAIPLAINYTYIRGKDVTAGTLTLKYIRCITIRFLCFGISHEVYCWGGKDE